MNCLITKYREIANTIKAKFEPERLSPEEHREDGGQPEDLHPVTMEAGSIATLDLKACYKKRELWYPLARRVARITSQGKYASGLSIGTVVHFDAGRGNPLNCLESGRKNNYLYSALGKDGAFYQPNPLNEWGWHVGKSTWKSGDKTLESLNRYFDGVEICSAGRVKKVNNDFFAPWYARNPNDYIHKSKVRFVTKGFNVLQDGYFEMYTPAQEAALIQYLLWRKVNDPLNYSFDNVVGHDEVAIPLGRKDDPGGALSMYMPALRQKLREEYEKLQLN